jgi:Xaa-Pro aminopeptidase
MVEGSFIRGWRASNAWIEWLIVSTTSPTMNYEMPNFSFPYQNRGRPETLAAGMVVAISNIGLFSDRDWGLRIEDTPLITDHEPSYLTTFPKELILV